MKKITLTFPGTRAKQEFEQKINDGSYIHQYSTKHDDGSIDAVYIYIKNSKSIKTNLPNEEQLNLF